MFSSSTSNDLKQKRVLGHGVERRRDVLADASRGQVDAVPPRDAQVFRVDGVSCVLSNMMKKQADQRASDKKETAGEAKAKDLFFWSTELKQ